MAVNLNRWLQYAKAKLDSAVTSGNKELDELEAEQRAAAEGKPWLTADGDAPTLEEARARIRWEAEEAAAQAKASGKVADHGKPGGSPGSGPAAPSTPKTPAPHEPAPAPGSASTGAAPPATSTPTPAGETPTPGPLDPADEQEAAARAQARIELEDRARESAARLEQIRAELGIDPPAGPPPAT